MTIQLDATTRSAMLDALEVSIGASPTLKLRTGSQPATCATADSGTVLATVAAPADWMAAASGGSKAIAGTWADSSADASGTPGHFRIYDSTGTCRMQGSVTGVDGNGDMKLSLATLVEGQAVQVSTFTVTAGNA
jgi:hypothetical protein